MKQSISIAKELREIIAASEVNLIAETSDVLKDEINLQHSQLVQQLFTSITALENLPLDTLDEISSINKDNLQRIADITDNLRVDLAVVTAKQDVIVQIEETKLGQALLDSPQLTDLKIDAVEESSIDKQMDIEKSAITTLEINVSEDIKEAVEIEPVIEDTKIQKIVDTAEGITEEEVNLSVEVTENVMETKEPEIISVCSDARPISLQEVAEIDIQKVAAEPILQITEEPLRKATIGNKIYIVPVVEIDANCTLLKWC